MHTNDEQFLTGVNYWPRHKAMYWWSDFDPAEVADEFDTIASLNLDIVRIFLLWDDWQPSPDTVPLQRLNDLLKVCDIARDRGLRLDITFFTGHMSGPNWAPSWLLERNVPYPSPLVHQVISGGRTVNSSYRNMFEDPTALDAERLLIDTVVGALSNHESIWMWNLGNEPDLFAHPHSRDAGRRWVEEMTDRVRAIDPNHHVTVGLHTESLFNDNGLRIDDVFASCDVAVMHGYPMYVPWAEGDLDADFVPFLCALTSALARKPCLAEEWGGCTAPLGAASTTWEWEAFGSHRTQFMANEEVFADYVSSVLPRLVETGATGAFLWSFADYATSLWDRPPCNDGGAKHERHFGLVRPDGSLKPHAEAIKAFGERQRRIKKRDWSGLLDIDPNAYYLDAEQHARRLYATYRDIVAS